MEIGFQSREQQALPKAPRAAEEVVSSGIRQLVNLGGLIDIEIAVLTNLLEVLYTDGINSLVHSAKYLM